MEAAIECDLSRADPAHAGDVLDALSDFVPGAVVLVGGGIARSGDGFVAEDKRVESDDFAVRVEDVEGELSGDEARDGSDDSESFFFAQHFEYVLLSCLELVDNSRLEASQLRFVDWGLDQNVSAPTAKDSGRRVDCDKTCKKGEETVTTNPDGKAT